MVAVVVSVVVLVIGDCSRPRFNDLVAVAAQIPADVAYDFFRRRL